MVIDPVCEIRKLAKDLNVQDISEYVLSDPKFSICSGSSGPHHHHYGDCGLATHTYEVISTSLMMADRYSTLYEINKQELFLAALFHDYGKTYDYEKVNDEWGTWVSTPHKKLIHHITRSVIFWNSCVDKEIVFEDIRDSVTHAIVSHHGLREWGSPVTPKTTVAIILHYADCISARLNEVKPSSPI